MAQLPVELREYHEQGRPLSCEIDVQPWRCEFWPLAEVEESNIGYGVPEFAPGYLGFATSGGGEMYSIAPNGAIVCLAFVGMSPTEALPIAGSWREFVSMLRSAI